MNTEVETKNELPADAVKGNAPDNDTTQTRKNYFSRILVVLRNGKKHISNILFVLAFLLVLTGAQALIFYGKFTPRISEADDKLLVLTMEKTRSEQLNVVQQQFQYLRADLKAQGEISSRVEDLYELMGEHYKESPLGTIEQVLAGMPLIKRLIDEKLKPDPDQPVEALAKASDDIDQFIIELENLHQIYTIPYEQLHADLQNPPWYLWPTGGVLRDVAGHLTSVTFNRAIYLSQIGEIGTARVLLSGMYGSKDDAELLGLIYYSLGRLQWELFLTRLEPENYFQAVDYLRQSLQVDPGSSLAKRLFDYMLSLTEAESQPGAGKGEPTVLTEGEAGAVQEPTPLF